MELVVCGGCRRHVDAREDRCPFCAAAITARPQRAMLRGRISRAAVFSAALVACESKQAPPAPAPPPVQQGSDDLEKMLDGDQHVADRAVPPPPMPTTDASLADAGAIATQAIDAGVSVDAGMDRAKILEHKRKERLRREQHERERQVEPPPPPPPPFDPMNIPKPYGAPPARRRLV